MTRRLGPGSPEPLGVTPRPGGVNVAVHSAHADLIEFCLFDAHGDRELERSPLPERTGDVFHGFVPDVPIGARYGLRARGPWAPHLGHRFNHAKLLVDPYARALDRPFVLHPSLDGQTRDGDPHPDDSAAVVPKGIVTAPMPPAADTRPRIAWQDTVLYELHAKGFTQRHPEVPAARRGTIGALATPAVIAHLVRLGVTTVELLPIAAWIDEPHLARAGLVNYWGYNTVGWMVPDPRLCPGGIVELRETVAALHAAGLEVLLDVVLNHSGEGDAHGPTLSLRGLDNATYYRTVPHEAHRYVNDSGCGNTLALDRPAAVRLAADTLRWYAEAANVDGFRFDLATAKGRRADGFDPEAPLLTAIAQDPVLRELKLVAEPWDIGPGGYRLGAFPAAWGEWNDRYRDTVRRFWRGDGGLAGQLATRLAGSADVFRGRRRPSSRSVNFVTAHDGFTLRDLVSYARKHNAANGEQDRDGTNANHSWNHGVEGETDDAAVLERRRRDVRALLATLLCSRGTPMLAMGDELGRTQGGNNNAYAQDNAATWVDWVAADDALTAFTAGLVALRRRHRALHDDRWLTGTSLPCCGLPDVEWLRPDGTTMAPPDWDGATTHALVAVLATEDLDGRLDRVTVAINAGAEPAALRLPAARPGHGWHLAADSAAAVIHATPTAVHGPNLPLPPRSVLVLVEVPAGPTA